MSAALVLLPMKEFESEMSPKSSGVEGLVPKGAVFIGGAFGK
jgi:hypothetical protein